MACSVATGTDWMNYPTTQCPVVYLCGEGKRGLMDRIRAWFDHKGLEPNDAPRLITQGGFAAQESQNVDRYISVVTEALLAAPQVKQSPALIIIDTYSRYAAGLDENSASETAVMDAQLNRLQELFGAAVMIDHHVSKGTGDARGSTALGSALDWQYKVLREGDGDSHSKAEDHQDLRATVVLTKCKDHQGPPPVHITGETIMLKDITRPKTVTQDVKALEEETARSHTTATPISLDCGLIGLRITHPVPECKPKYPDGPRWSGNFNG
tara:strand:- start:148 stop:951 length:804 start_codon:yes stop_codon:yes gene_type:complete